MTAKEGLKYISEKITNPEEPIFILRGRDTLASIAVLDWARAAEGAGVREQKVCDAIKVAVKMRAWSPTRLPD